MKLLAPPAAALAALTFIACTTADARAAGAEAAAAGRPTFHQGLWTLQLNGNYAYDFEDEDAWPASGSVSASYYVWDNLSIGGELNAYHVRQPGDDAAAYGAGLTLKHHLLRWDEGTGHAKTLYFDGGFSTFDADEPVPPGGTEFNYVTRLGLGLTWQIDDNVHFLTGARFFHLSNAGKEGRVRNPSIDAAVEGFVGIMITF